ITIETNGIGNFAPAALKGALKKRRIRCGITEQHSTQSKNKRILEGLEGPLVSGMLWVHVSVIDTEDGENTSKQYKQMQQFNPALSDQE
ncbi:transcriptional regulator, partial [Acinetobacter baumannii]